MFASGRIVNHNPILIEYPEAEYSMLENPDQSYEPKAKYFSPFEHLNNFLNINNPEYNDVYIWTTYDENQNLIQNPSGKLPINNMIEL